MKVLAGRLGEAGWRRVAFSLVILVLLAILTLFSGMILLGPILLFFPDGLGVNPDLGPHRFHALAISLVTWTVIIGLLSQLRSPRANVAGHAMVLLNFLALGLAFALTGYSDSLVPFTVLGGLALVATVLHPAGRAFLRSFVVERTNRVLLILVLIAAVPLVAYAGVQIGLHNEAIQPTHDHGASGHSEEAHEVHIDNGHFVNSAALSFVVIGAGLLGSLRPDGWWVPAWYSGLVPVLLGLLSLLYPETSSAFDPLWAVAAVAWGVVFIAAAEYTQSTDAPTMFGRLGIVPTN